jgi:hypothetical protein
VQCSGIIISDLLSAEDVLLFSSKFLTISKVKNECNFSITILIWPNTIAGPAGLVTPSEGSGMEKVRFWSKLRKFGFGGVLLMRIVV